MCKNLLKLIFILLMTQGCANKTKFANDTRKKAPLETKEEDVVTPTPSIEDIKLSCDNGTNEPITTINKSGNAGQQYRIIGEICETQQSQFQTGELHILFIIDISGSMTRNDPFSNNSCGRYQSIQTILEKTKSKISGESNVHLGIIKFHDNAAISTDFHNLKDPLTIEPKEVCDSASDTNYKAAFERAQNMLSDKSGKKIIYFITDGVPTDKVAGLEGAKNFFVSVQNQDLYMIYLNQDPKTNKAAKEYLITLVGDESKIKLVNEANQLAPEIEKIELPNVTFNSPKIKLKNPQTESNISLKNFSQVAEGRWSFSTAPFELLGVENSPTQNSVYIESDDTNNVKLRIDINFTLLK